MNDEKTVKNIKLSKIGARLEGYGIGYLVGETMADCWITLLIPVLDLDGVSFIGNDFYDGCIDGVLKRLFFYKTKHFLETLSVEQYNKFKKICFHLTLVNDIIKTQTNFHEVFVLIREKAKQFNILCLE